MIALLGLLLAADRIPLPSDGGFEARPGKNVRVRVDRLAEIRVNELYVGETKSEIDITGFLRTGMNEVKTSAKATLIFSPPVYLQSAVSDGSSLRVSVVNTTQHTMQVELDSLHQFTVSPGTSRDVTVPATQRTTARIRATSDGLDLDYEDDLPITPGEACSRFDLGSRLMAIAPTTDKMKIACSAKA